ncbi:hypothetical protein OEZ86_013093 [Tetradesmus obliquus]|nr:hypothetical protein OEZ86_013093 [Tetradesmus obliquus]
MQALQQFMQQHVFPSEAAFDAHAHGPNRWTIHPLNEQLKGKARAAGLWNLWMAADMAAKLQHLLPQVPEQERATLLGAGLSHLDYAHICAVMGCSVWGPELFNCSAPDTGNMEVLAKYGTPEQQCTWLLPLLRGHIRSCFAMTEKAVASSDATNITSAITRSSSSSSSSSNGSGSCCGAGGGSYVVQGLKWWTSGAMDPRCKVAIFMGKTDSSAPPHRQQSMLLVPMDAPGVKVLRPLSVFGYDDAPHGHAEVLFDGVVVPASNLLLGEGRGFEIAQGRLGPGRLHHCMRLIGMSERALRLAATRALQRNAFGQPLAAQGGLREVLARQRVALEGARLLVLNAAEALDSWGWARLPVLDAAEALDSWGWARLPVLDAAEALDSWGWARLPVLDAAEALDSWGWARLPVLDAAEALDSWGWARLPVLDAAEALDSWGWARLPVLDAAEALDSWGWARLPVLDAATALDRVGHKAARAEIAAAKVAAPAVALQVIDAAIQIHGGAGVSQDVPLGHLFATARTLRIADGPDEVHLGTLAKLELEAAAGGREVLKSIMGRARL